MNFTADADNDIVQGMEDQLAGQGQARDASDQAKQAWELAKTQAQGQYRPDQPEYWPHVQQLSYDLLGLKQDADRPVIQAPGQEPTAQGQTGTSVKPSRPLAMGQGSTQAPNPMNPSQPNQKGYPSYGEAVRRVKNQSKTDNDKVFSGLDWVTAAKDMVKELKAAKVGEENIIFSLVNRIGLSPETAKLFHDGKYKEELDEETVREARMVFSWRGYANNDPASIKGEVCATYLDISPAKAMRIAREQHPDFSHYFAIREPVPDINCYGRFDPEMGRMKYYIAGTSERKYFGMKPDEYSVYDPAAMKEDNVYNHMSITTRSGYPYEDYGMDNNRDPFEWEMSSTRYVAKALVIDGRYTYECRFEILQSDTARWPHPWNFLKTDHGVNFVLKISVNQLNVNSNYMRLTPDSTPISFNNESNLLKTMKQMFDSYNKIWSSNSYQLIVMGTQSIQKLTFLMKVAKEFSKASGVKVHEKISTELTEKATEDTAQRNMMWIALTNSKGGKIKEGKVTFESQGQGREKLETIWSPYLNLFHDVMWGFSNSGLSKASLKSGKLSMGMKRSKQGGIAYCVYYGMKCILYLPETVRMRLDPFTMYYEEGYMDQIQEYYQLLKVLKQTKEENKAGKKDMEDAYSEVDGLNSDTFKESSTDLEEDLVDETTNSSAFSATPFDAAHDFRKDGDEINSQARKSLISMGIISESDTFNGAGKEKRMTEKLASLRKP